MRELPFVNIETFVTNFKQKLCKWYKGASITIFLLNGKNLPALADVLEGILRELPDWT